MSIDQHLFALNVSDIRYIAWDTETTGAQVSKDHLVEIAALAFDEEFDHRSFQELVRPPISIPHEVVKVHGIKDDTVKNAPDAKVVLTRFDEFLKSAGSPRILIAHNAAFDLGMVYTECDRFIEAGKVSVKKKIDLFLQPEILIDSCMLAKNLLPDLRHHKLKSLADYFKIDTGRLHRATEDVRVLKEVFIRLLAMAADQPRQGSFTVEKLIDLCGGYFLFDPFSRSADRKKAFYYSSQIQQLKELCGLDQMVSIVYKELTEESRYITPIEVNQRGFRVYVEAFCHRDQIKKSFRADRILKVKMRSE